MKQILEEFPNAYHDARGNLCNGSWGSRLHAEEFHWLGKSVLKERVDFSWLEAWLLPIPPKKKLYAFMLHTGAVSFSHKEIDPEKLKQGWTLAPDYNIEYDS